MIYLLKIKTISKRWLKPKKKKKKKRINYTKLPLGLKKWHYPPNVSWNNTHLLEVCINATIIFLITKYSILKNVSINTLKGWGWVWEHFNKPWFWLNALFEKRSLEIHCQTTILKAKSRLHSMLFVFVTQIST